MLKVFKKKALVVGILATLSFGSVNNVHASGIPTFDAVLNAVVNNQYIQDALQWAEEKAIMLSQMAQDIAIHMQQVLNDQNIAANEIARKTQTASDIANIQLAQELARSNNTCAANAFSAFSDENRCASTASKASSRARASGSGGGSIDTPDNPPSGAKDIADDHEKTRKAGLPANEVTRRHLANIENQIINTFRECSPLSDVDDSKGLKKINIHVDGEEGDFSVARCSIGGHLVGGSKDSDNDPYQYSEEEAEAVKDTIRLLVNTDGANSIRNSLDANPAGDLRDMRRDAYRSMITESFIINSELYTPIETASGEEISFMSALNQTISEQFGSIESILGLEDSNTSGSAQNAKDIAMLTRMLVYLEHLKFKQNSRIEVLMAANLAYKIEGVDTQKSPDGNDDVIFMLEQILNRLN